MDDLVVGVDRDEKGFFWLNFTVTDPVVGTHQKFESPLGPYYTEDEAWEAAESLVNADSEEE